MTIVTESATDAKLARPSDSWHQLLILRGDAIRLVERVSNYARRDPESNEVTLRGDGAWFPKMRGLSWVAMCIQSRHEYPQLGDLRPILHVLLDATPMPMSDAPREEVAAWLHGDAR